MAPEVHNVERDAESRLRWAGTPWPDDRPMPKWTDKDVIQDSSTGKGMANGQGQGGGQ